MKFARFAHWDVQHQNIFAVHYRVGKDLGGRVNERLVARELEVCRDDFGLVAFDGDFGGIDAEFLVAELRNGN